MSWIETGIKELEDWEQRLLAALADIFSPDTILNYLDEYNNDRQGLYERAEWAEGLFTPSIYSAISGISQIRSLLVEIKKPLPDIIPIEIAARLSILMFRAGFNTGYTAPGIGMNVIEPFAKTRFAQMQNQPKYRNRDNIEHEDILVRLDAYVQENGKVPPSIERFIIFLEKYGYEIDSANKTVNPPIGSEIKWRKSRTFGTIDNWRREFKFNVRTD